MREQARAAAQVPLDAARRDQIRELAQDFPRVWQDPATPDRERKRMIRLLLEDVTLLRTATGFTLGLRWRSGATETLELPLLRSAPDARRTAATVVARVDELLATMTDAAVAETLNAEGYRTGTGQPFDRLLVRYIRVTYGLTDPFTRLRAQGYLTKAEMAARLGIDPHTLVAWKRQGWVRAIPYNDKGECVYDPHGPCPPKWKRKRSAPSAPPLATTQEGGAP